MNKLHVIALGCLFVAGVAKAQDQIIQEFIKAQQNFANVQREFTKKQRVLSEKQRELSQKYFIYCPAPVTPTPQNKNYNNLVSLKKFAAQYSNPLYGGIGGARTCYIFSKQYQFIPSKQQNYEIKPSRAPSEMPGGKPWQL